MSKTEMFVSMRYHKVHHLIICPKQRCFYALSQGTPSYNMSKIKDVSMRYHKVHHLIYVQNRDVFMRYHKVHHLIICSKQRCFYALSQGTPSYIMSKPTMFLCAITRYAILQYNMSRTKMFLCSITRYTIL